jgi:transposase-like protein
MRDALAHVAKGQRDMAAAVIRNTSVQENYEAAVAQWRQVPDSLRPRFEKLAELMIACG